MVFIFSHWLNNGSTMHLQLGKALLFQGLSQGNALFFAEKRPWCVVVFRGKGLTIVINGD
jgi:hypothetical protein